MGAPNDPSSFIQMIETIESTSTGPLIVGIEEIVRRIMPRALAHLAAKEFMPLARAATPVWRWVSAASPATGSNMMVAARGTSLAGVGGLALTLGVPLVVAAGVWVMLGSGYNAARQEVRRKGLMTGFSHGFVTAVHKWTFDQTLGGFLKRFVVHTNVWDSAMDREETLGYNEGLIKGWGIGEAVPESLVLYKDTYTHKFVDIVEHDKRYKDRIGLEPINFDKKKAFRIALRRLANNHFTGPWSMNEDIKHVQQSSYVRDLGGSALRHGLLLPE